MHGPTFMANPLACAVALASLELLDGQGAREDPAEAAGGARAGDAPAPRGGGWRARVAAIERGLRAGLAPAREIEGVRDVRVLGAIGVIELEHEVDVANASAAAVRRGVWLRPFRELIYTMPPYVIDQQDLATVAAAAVDAARANTAEGG
jgi:adenosylmethionine-8-amino-7-oxononanoate aminotransferase